MVMKRAEPVGNPTTPRKPEHPEETLEIRRERFGAVSLYLVNCAHFIKKERRDLVIKVICN